MKGIDLIAAFELEINKLDDALEKPVTDDSLYWINQAIMKFVKDRFNGNAPKRTSYEQNEKRTRDLIKLLREDKSTVILKYLSDYNGPVDYTFLSLTDSDETIQETKKYTATDIDLAFNLGDDIKNLRLLEGDCVQINVEIESVDELIQKTYYFIVQSTFVFDNTHKNYDSYEYTYPADMMFTLNEDVEITDMEGKNAMDTCVFECTADSFMYRVNNSLTDFHYRYHRARPLRVRTKDGFRLLTDKNYKIASYTLGYLKVPEEITSEGWDSEYTDFEDYTWLEIIKIAAQMYVENQSDPRYKTLTAEVLTQE